MNKFKLNIPGNIEDLRAGDKVLLSGVIVTARDRAHNWLIEKKQDVSINAVYHCGPVIDGDKVVSAGPTTSARMNETECEVIEKYGISVVIGKGGMSDEVHKCMIKNKCVYLSALGGGGAILEDSIVAIKDVKQKEFGVPEALWFFEVKDFPVIIAMDIHGGNIFTDVEKKSKENMSKILK